MGAKSPQEVIEHNRQLQAQIGPTMRALIDAMKGQLLLVLVERLGGSIRVPVAEIDDTGGLLLAMRVDGADFVFTVERKN